MPSALSSSTGTGSTGSTGSTASSGARGTGGGKDFRQMLQGSPETAAKAPPASKAQPGKAGASSHGAPANPDGSADKPSSAATDSDAAPTEAATASSPSTSPAADDNDTASEGDDAPWPPLGLAGLVLAVPVPTDGVGSTPAASANGVDAGLPAAAPTLPAAAPLAAGAPASSAVTAATAGSDGQITTQQLPDMILGQQALDGADDADSLLIGDRTPPAPLQAPLPAALQDLKAALGSTAAFNGEPTPTPTLGDDGFDQAVGARLGWLADQKIGHAHIRLNPEDLGPVDVRLQMNGDKVHASFSSPHVEVRQALESSLPRLRELLGEQGFQLAHADVGHSGSGDGGTSAQPGGTGDLAGGDGEPSRGDTTVSAAQLMRQRGLLDAYA
ncbi:flagellar hook-length control protein FliK [Stenotrophomonas sp. NPDC077659]|uniref:flagellar hook-length control protein FliK n=1 Tax=Stenotrophomonas sp. NPDC077659 TaxID=3390694 RepID=UPI003D001C4B